MEMGRYMLGGRGKLGVWECTDICEGGRGKLGVWEWEDIYERGRGKLAVWEWEDICEGWIWKEKVNACKKIISPRLQ